MMKRLSYYFIVIIFLASSLYASVVIKIDNGVKLKKALKNRVETYWKARAKKDFETSYKFELPYLNYIHSEDWYEIFFQNASKFSKIELKKIKSCNKSICIIGLLLRYRFNPDNFIFLYDKWIKVDGIWYHKYDDNPLPNFNQ